MYNEVIEERGVVEMEVIKEVLSVVFVLDEKKYGKLDGWDKLSGVMKEKYKECEKM